MADDIRLRELRKSRGFTLQDLADRSGLSVAMLSQVERGISDPSLDALRRLAAALDVTLTDIFRPADPVDVALVPRDRRVTISAPSGRIAYTRISPGFGTAEVLEGALGAGEASSETPWAHDAEESILVLDGSLVVEVGLAQYRLSEGDSCLFDSRLPHRYRNDTRGSTRFLLIVTPRS